MKKYRLVSFFLCIPLLAGLLVLPAAAAGSADPTATAEASGIVAGMHIEARAALLAPTRIPTRCSTPRTPMSGCTPPASPR